MARSGRSIAEMQHISRRIAGMRTERGISQKELADRVGIKSRRLSDIERGISKPDIVLFIAIARALNVNIRYLTYLTHTKRPFSEEDC